jgi:hypothetical protein
MKKYSAPIELFNKMLPSYAEIISQLSGNGFHKVEFGAVFTVDEKIYSLTNKKAR